MNLPIANTVVVGLILILGFGLAFGVYISNQNKRVNQLLALLIAFAMTNLFFSFLLNYSGSFNISLLSGKLTWATASVGVVFFYYFIGYFPTSEKRFLSIDRILVLIIGGVLAGLSIFTSLIVKDIKVGGDSVEVIAGSFANFYNVVIVAIILSAFYILFKKYFKVSKIEKLKIQNFMVGLFLFVVSTLFFSVLLPAVFGIDKYTFLGDYSIIVFFSMAAYAIARHGLFDVRLAIVRSVSYAIIIVTLAGIYALIAFAFSLIFNRGPVSIEQTAIGVVSSIIMALLVQPLKRFFDKVSNRIFYKDNYHVADFIARLNTILTQTTDLRNLLERVSFEIGTTLKAEQAFFFVFTKPDGRYLSAGTDHHTQMPLRDAVLIEEKSQGISKVISASALDDGDPIKRMMISHKIELILPLIQDANVIGFLCMGDHLNSGYTNRDIRALNTISNELIIAIQNAAAVHEIREINATLQQRIANATKELRSSNAILRQLDKVKDEFISMASHQLRTPLTSVKGYLSMVIEGDAGKITNSQKQLLDQAFMSSENMVHLINDFLNVSRIQSGKFVIDKTEVDLSRLVEEEVNGLRPNAEARKMKLVYKKPKKFPTVEIDEGKFRQVIMNFSDNAIYYSHENSSIVISLAVDGKDIIFTVKDTGIGVPKSEKDKLFAKFYRAANAKVQRPDGTGVGIYLAKKVIDAHGGKIIFESVEGKGSTFGFRLPLPKDK